MAFQRAPKVIALAILLTPFAAHADFANVSRRMDIESVNDYSQCNGPNLVNANANADGFAAGMTASPNPAQYRIEYSGGPSRWVDNDVWVTDFLDPDWATPDAPLNQDLLYFDAEQVAISWFSGHGLCFTGQTGDTGIVCTHDSQCNSPPPPQSGGFCRRLPGNTSGKCAYTPISEFGAVGNCAAQNPSLQGAFEYGCPDCKANFGESQYSGAWRGVGTNGGTNFVVMDSSCASMTFRWNALTWAFAGVHMIATVAVHDHTMDSADVSDSGANFAAAYQLNSGDKISESWVRTMASETQASGCVVNGVRYGTGGGVQGCGAGAVTTVGNTADEVTIHLNETWATVQMNPNTIGYDGKGNFYGGTRYVCNYVCTGNNSLNIP
jgi:hypothetical protein